MQFVFIVGYTNYSFWISATDLAESRNFFWLSTGRPLSYTNWMKNEPNNVNNSEHCVHTHFIEDDIKWNDINCNLQLYILCEDRLYKK